MIARLDGVEARAAVDDGPREDVEPSGAALRVDPAVETVGKRDALHQGHDIDATRLEDRAGT